MNPGGSYATQGSHAHTGEGVCAPPAPEVFIRSPPLHKPAGLLFLSFLARHLLSGETESSKTGFGLPRETGDQKMIQGRRFKNTWKQLDEIKLPAPFAAGSVMATHMPQPMKSVPPRGSGWVSPLVDKCEPDPFAPRRGSRLRCWRRQKLSP